jgi:hypothetical protein
MVQQAQNCGVPSSNKQRDYGCNMGSSLHHSMFEQDNILAMNRLVETTMAPLEIEEQAIRVVSPSRPFLLLWVIGVASSDDHKGQPFSKAGTTLTSQPEVLDDFCFDAHVSGCRCLKEQGRHDL